MVSEPRTVSGINAVELDTSGILTITQGESESLTIEAEDNLLPLLTSEVFNGRLQLGVKSDNRISATKPIRYTLAVKDLSAISVNGSGSINVSDFVTSQAMRIEGNGSGGLTFTSSRRNLPSGWPLDV